MFVNHDTTIRKLIFFSDVDAREHIYMRACVLKCSTTLRAGGRV